MSSIKFSEWTNFPSLSKNLCITVTSESPIDIITNFVSVTIIINHYHHNHDDHHHHHDYVNLTKFTWRQHVTACKLVDFHSTNDHIPEDKIIHLSVLDLLQSSFPKARLYTYVVHTYKRLCRVKHHKSWSWIWNTSFSWQEAIRTSGGIQPSQTAHPPLLGLRMFSRIFLLFYLHI
jgi:hypothetical protein